MRVIIIYQNRECVLDYELLESNEYFHCVVNQSEHPSRRGICILMQIRIVLAGGDMTQSLSVKINAYVPVHRTCLCLNQKDVVVYLLDPVQLQPKANIIFICFLLTSHNGRINSGERFSNQILRNKNISLQCTFKVLLTTCPTLRTKSFSVPFRCLF